MSSLRPHILTIAIAWAAIAAHAQVPVLNSYPIARATVYLDFNRQNIQGTIWNRKGPIIAEAAGLSGFDISVIFKHVAGDYQAFNLNITTDSNIFNKAPQQQRIRIIFTSSSSWYGASSGGASGIGSFTWGDDTPAWVFCDLLGMNIRYIADAASHEIGHSMGLQHQSLYNDVGNKIAEYNGGEGNAESGWAPIMGVSYYKANTGWLTGTSTLSSDNIQDDLEIIAGSPNNFGYRNTDTPKDTAISPGVSLSGKQQNGIHYLSWHASSIDSIDQFVLEFTKDGIHFQTLTVLPAADQGFSYRPAADENLGYRINTLQGANQSSSFSNIVTLKTEASEQKVRILYNPVRDLLTVSSTGNFSYQLLDVDGRIISRGQLHTGINEVPVQNEPRGLLLFHWEDPIQQGTEKLIKQ